MGYVEAMIVFLEPLFGRFEMYGGIKDDVPFMRYLFGNATDAAAFRIGFGGESENPSFNLAG